MWRACITVIGECFSNAVHVLDRFHIVGHLNQAVDNVRRFEVKKLKVAGEPAYLKNAEDLPEKEKSVVGKTQGAPTRSPGSESSHGKSVFV